MNPWILAARPRTLGAAIIPVLAGCALAVSGDAFDPYFSVLILVCAIFIQIGTNYFNDAIDHAKGADTPERIGPVRATSAGLLPTRAMMTGGALSLAVAAVSAIPLVLHGGWPILVLGTISLLLAYAYTGGPFPIAYVGFGEIFVVLFFGVFAVAGTFFLNTLEVSAASALAGLQIGIHSSVLLAVNNLRDLETDRAARKRTLAARFGLTFARRENAALVIAPFVIGILWLPLGYFWAFLLPLMTMPLAWSLARTSLEAEPARETNQLLARAAALHAAFGLLLALAFLLP